MTQRALIPPVLHRSSCLLVLPEGVIPDKSDERVDSILAGTVFCRKVTKLTKVSILGDSARAREEQG